ncbi:MULTISPECIES: Hsp20/alpha crystallin family protein [unclassified Rhodococcus (in: high G+C Gram-positive bacteria)]|uniref:Hsp20/alpha crystallin family protein n=1 Tax=unclassified Rhodococcus (in: high G+C Gram-positive bacteria) TaxID=192944 RepID=UPI0028A11C2D|nr:MULTISPECIES: Hsp20/alpha crystallin family protein [unclassified Rhodococcus (in: high G+C Gram-positive bacteria)]
MKHEDLNITLSANELEISGEFAEKKRAGWLRTRSRTRRTGRFEFRTLLAREVDADTITAALADGVLTVTIPKSASARSRRIEVTTDRPPPPSPTPTRAPANRRRWQPIGTRKGTHT